MDIEETERRVYVINHADNGERIEVLDVKTNAEDVPVELTYLYTIASDELNKVAYMALNSIAVVAPNKIYATQWIGAEELENKEK